MKNIKLIFVYNADSDLPSSLIDMVHKIVKPSTYQCNLCMITYGPLSMKKEWRDFIDSLEIETEFLHRDEFQKKYKSQEKKLPAVFIEKNKKVELLITAKEINNCKSIRDLKELVREKLSFRKTP